MTEKDLVYVNNLMGSGRIKGPLLEMGAGYGGRDCRDLCKKHELEYFSTDMDGPSAVDFVADFEDDESLKVFGGRKFSTILCLNVLEHTFNPVKILDSCVSILEGTGNLVALTPTVWTLHNYPFDTFRINPDFYVEYAKRRGLKLRLDDLEYVGFGPVGSFRDEEGNFKYPPPAKSRFHNTYSKVISRVFNTIGRAMHCPRNFATAAVFQKQAEFNSDKVSGSLPFRPSGGHKHE